MRVGNRNCVTRVSVQVTREVRDDLRGGNFSAGVVRSSDHEHRLVPELLGERAEDGVGLDDLVLANLERNGLATPVRGAWTEEASQVRPYLNSQLSGKPFCSVRLERSTCATRSATQPLEGEQGCARTPVGDENKRILLLQVVIS